MVQMKKKKSKCEHYKRAKLNIFIIINQEYLHYYTFRQNLEKGNLLLEKKYLICSL